MLEMVQGQTPQAHTTLHQSTQMRKDMADGRRKVHQSRAMQQYYTYLQGLLDPAQVDFSEQVTPLCLMQQCPCPDLHCSCTSAQTVGVSWASSACLCQGCSVGISLVCQQSLQALFECVPGALTWSWCIAGSVPCKAAGGGTSRAAAGGADQGLPQGSARPAAHSQPAGKCMLCVFGSAEMV